MEPSETDADQGLWRYVPEEITARIMSRLPVPAFCTCRAVCKTWNGLLRRPAFLDLCDRDEKKDDSAYLFVTAHLVCVSNRRVDGNYRQTTCFMDLPKGRWSSTGSRRTPSDADVLYLTMNDGLICEFSSVDKECRLVMFDPVSTTTRALPAVNVSTFPRSCYLPPAIVTVVHNSSFKVFLLCQEGLPTGFFLYESSTDAWRDLRSPLAVEGMRRGRVVHSAVYFQGIFYATFAGDDRVLLGSYNLEENSWKEVFTVDRRCPGFPQLIVPQLIVYKTRMFMPVWLDSEAHGALLQTRIRGGWRSSIFEIREIMKDSSSKSVVRIPYLDLQRIFYGEEDAKGLILDIGCAFAINSYSVVLVSRYSGKLVVYNVMSGCAVELPAHPLSQASCKIAKEEGLMTHFSAKLMNLSVRNILASFPTPVSCTRSTLSEPPSKP